MGCPRQIGQRKRFGRGESTKDRAANRNSVARIATMSARERGYRSCARIRTRDGGPCVKRLTSVADLAAGCGWESQHATADQVDQPLQAKTLGSLSERLRAGREHPPGQPAAGELEL
jgi:hypothetical protein